jgi:uncharacterized membrane protein
MSLLIILLAFLLRLPHMTSSLWLDESIEALALMGRLGPLLSYALADYQPPLYHFISYGVTHLLGYSEIVLRLPSFIAGLITVYGVMKIAAVIGGRRMSTIAGLLAATNPLLIYYAQEGRTYGLTTCFATLSFYCLIRLLGKEKKRVHIYLGYALMTASMLWTSYLSWFFLLAQGTYIIYRKRYDILGLQVLAALTWLLWLPSFISSLQVGQYTLGTSAAWGQVVGGLAWKSLPLTWVKFVIGRISFDNKLLYGIIVTILAAIHAMVLRKAGSFSLPHRPLLVWLIPPVILGLLTASILPVYSYFRVLFVLPAYLLLLANGLSKMNKYWTYALIAIQISFFLIFWITPRFHHEDWRTLSADLQVDAGAQIGLPSDEQNPGLLYYGIDESRIFEPSHEPIVTNRIYYVRYAEELFDGEKRGPANLAAAGYTIVGERTYPGLALDIYEKK